MIQWINNFSMLHWTLIHTIGFSCVFYFVYFWQVHFRPQKYSFWIEATFYDEWMNKNIDLEVTFCVCFIYLLFLTSFITSIHNLTGSVPFYIFKVRPALHASWFLILTSSSQPHSSFSYSSRAWKGDTHSTHVQTVFTLKFVEERRACEKVSSSFNSFQMHSSAVREKYPQPSWATDGFFPENKKTFVELTGCLTKVSRSCISPGFFHPNIRHKSCSLIRYQECLRFFLDYT